jgi:hypothetical protein
MEITQGSFNDSLVLFPETKGPSAFALSSAVVCNNVHRCPTIQKATLTGADRRVDGVL